MLERLLRAGVLPELVDGDLILSHGVLGEVGGGSDLERGVAGEVVEERVDLGVEGRVEVPSVRVLGVADVLELAAVEFDHLLAVVDLDLVPGGLFDLQVPFKVPEAAISLNL